jgi:hypothetical protein
MTMSDSASTRDLRWLFCERFNCPATEFEERALRKCLFLHARIIAPLLRWANPRCFERDLLFIHYFGNAKNLQEVAVEVGALHDHDLQQPFGRNVLRIRISGRKASHLAAKLFPPNPAGPAR